jgi:hypothetical protein
MMTYGNASLVVAAAVVSLAACVETTTTTYVRQSNTVVEQAYIQPGADFSKYTKLMTDGLEIYYPQSDAAPPEEQLERIRESFRSAFSNAIGDDYEVVNTPGPDVLMVKAQLIDMKVTGAAGGYTASGRLRDLVARGELTFLMEMSDSESGDVLARAADRTTDVSTGGDAAEWAEVDKAAKYWAGLFRNWLDNSLGKANQD